ncbi:MAG: ABC transporter permease [Bacteroidaceae bacterium]|nr:ABC transporter permease [Bacteroidaceae bacterium]
MTKYLLLFKREFLRIADRPVYWFVMVIAPLGVYAFFVLLMRAGLPSELPVGLVDLDQTATSRSIARNLDAFQRTHIVENYANVSEARRAMQRGDIYAFFLIPHGATHKANRQQQATVSFYVNYSYLIAASLTYQDLRMMSELASGAAARRVLYAKGVTEEQAMAYLQPIVMDTHPLNNPQLNYNVYLSNTIIPGMLLLFVSLLTAYSVGTEIKDGTAHEWMQLARGSIKRALWVKLVPQFIIFFLMGTIYVLLFYAVLHFPCQCGIPTMLGAMTLLVLAGQGLGLFFFALLPSLRMSMSMCSLWGVLSFSMSGMSYPVMAMHPAIQGLADFFPLRHYFLIYVNCALDGFGWQYATWNILALLLFAFAPLLFMPRLKYSVLHYRYVP